MERSSSNSESVSTRVSHLVSDEGKYDLRDDADSPQINLFAMTFSLF